MTESSENVAAVRAVSITPAAIPTSGSGHGVRVMQNTAVVFIGRCVGVMLAASANLLLVRSLGAERLGQYGAIYAYLSLFAWIAAIGLSPLIAREAAQDRANAASIVFTGVCISAAFTLVAIIAALTLSPLAHMDGGLLPLLVIGSVEILLLVPFGLPGIVFQIDLRQWYTTGFSVIRQLLWFVIVVALYWAGAPLLYVVLGRVVVATVEVGLNWHVGYRFLGPSRIFIRPMALRLVRGGFIVALTSVAISIYLRIDQVMLHSMANDRVLGQYVAAVRVSELFELLPAAFISSLFPLLCISLADPARFRRHLDLGYRYMVLAAAGISVFFCVGARPLVHLFYGEQYSSAASLLAVLIWSEIAAFFGCMLNNSLIAAGLQRFILWPTVLGAVVNIALNIYLIPRWGAMGAAWATVLAYWTCYPLAFIPFRSVRGILWAGLRLLAPITMVALLVTGVTFLLHVNDWFRMGIAVLGFAGIACILGFARKQDLEFVRLAWKTRFGTRAAY